MSIRVSLNKIKELNLGDNKIFAFFQKELGDMVSFDRGEDAFWFAQTMENLLAEKMEEVNDAGLLDNYKNLIVTAKWQAMNFLSEEEILELFENHFKEALEISGYDVWSKLKSKLVGILVVEERDILKSKIREALSKNKQKISKDNIFIEDRLVSPTIGNWLQSYVKAVGIGQPDGLKKSEFFSSGKNMQTLDAIAREKIIYFFNFYERIKLSSLSVNGAEETIPVTDNEWTNEEGVIRNGRFEPITQKMKDDFYKDLQAIFPERLRKENPIDFSPEDIEKKYQENLGGEEGIKKIEEEIVGVAKNNGAKIMDMIYEELSPKDSAKIINKERVVACLRAAAILGELGGLLKDNRFAGLVEKYLDERNNAQALNDFRINPLAPNNLIFLLRYILEDILKFSGEKSAGIGVQLVSLMRKRGDNKFNNIVYFDEERGGFVWAE